MPKPLKPRKSLTARQQAFVQYYALTGNGVKSARMAGYKNGPGIWTAAYRLLQDAEICLEIERFREFEFTGLREEITEQIHRDIMTGLGRNSSYRTGAKAFRFAQKLGVFEYYNTVEQEIKNMEERFGVSFRTILAALAEVDEDPRLPAMCQAMGEKHQAAETP